MSSPIVASAQNAPVEASLALEMRRAESKAKSPPPPVAKKPTSKQSTPVHNANNLNHSQSGTEGSAGERPLSSDLSLSPTHKDVISAIDGTPSVMDRIKVCTCIMLVVVWGTGRALCCCLLSEL